MARGPVRPFPKHSLKEALAVAEAIQQNNNGNPINPILLAKALGVGASSSVFRDLISSSEKFGLTSGGWKDEFIVMEKNGQSIVAPKSAEERIDALRRSLLNVPFYQKFFTYYNGGKLPQEEFLKNILKQEFDIPDQFISECIQLIKDNAKYVGIIENVSGSEYIVLNKTSQIETPKEEKKIVEESADANKEEKEVIQVKNEEDKALSSSGHPVQKTKSSKIFIGHGKNKKPLEELKRILDEFNVPYIVAEEEANRARPISRKVAEIMSSCTSAILIFTKDEHFLSESNEDIWRPSENVIHELGAASVLYDNKIVIFKEEGINLPSNFRDIGYIEFGDSGLTAKTMDLIRELIGFGLIKLTAS